MMYQHNQGTIPSAAGTGTGSTSISPDLPSGIIIGDLLILFVATKPDTATINTPAGWTAVPNGAGAGGGGTTGADTGPTRFASFYQVYDGVSAAPTVSVTSGNSSWAMIFSYRNDSLGWSVEGTNGTDSTTGAGWSVTGAQDPGITKDDRVIIGSSIPTDVTTPGQFSAQLLTATGCEFHAMQELAEPESTTGNQIGGFVTEVICTLGPSSAAPVYTATAGGTTTNVRGVSVIVRVREVPVRMGATAIVRQASISRANNW